MGLRDYLERHSAALMYGTLVFLFLATVVPVVVKKTYYEDKTQDVKVDSREKPSGLGRMID